MHGTINYKEKQNMDRIIRKIDGYSDRAFIVEKGARRFLVSYWTIVCYTDENGKFHRTWGGWSLTTVNNHVKKFGYSFSKKKWEALPCEDLPADIEEHDVITFEDANRTIKNVAC